MNENESLEEFLDLPSPMMEPREVENYLRQRTLLEAEIAALRRQMEAKISQKKTELGELNFHHEKRFEQTMRDLQAQQGGKTFHFDYASVKFRKAGGKMVVVDEAAALNYANWIGSCQPNGNCIVTTRKLDKDAYLKFFCGYQCAHEGELPPGVDIEPERLSMSVSSGAKDDE